MSVLGWLIVLSLPIYAVVQLWVILALGRRFRLDEDADVMPAGAIYSGADPWTDPSRRRTGETPGVASTVHCYVCGSENDAGYTFCASCVARLPLSR